MRDWLVGDPIGDGNDIGVPDTGYMGHPRDDGDTDEVVDDFKWNLNHSLYLYNDKSYGKAFRYLKWAFGIYSKMSDFQKSQLRKDPFNRYWIVDLCCRTVNEHGDDFKNALDMIVGIGLHVNMCPDCACMYPADYDRCIRCGKPLERPYAKSIDRIAQEIPGALRNTYVDENDYERVASRCVKLMKSNDSRLVSIEDGRGLCTDFVFEKTHRYFKTRYVCEYNPSYCTTLVFDEFDVCHEYDDLYSDASFISLVKGVEKRNGFAFKECRGGFGYQLDDNGYDFIFNDEIRIGVNFDMGDGRIAVYDLDLDNMKLSDDYRIY